MNDFIDFLIICAVVFGPSLAVIVWFVISLVLLARTPKDDAKRRPRKVRAVISGIIAALVVGAAVLAVIAFVFMFLGAMAHM